VKQITPFGSTQDGCDVAQITISSDELTVNILTLGSVINDVRLTGVAWPLTLGSSEVAAYEGKMSSFGSLMGPVINRIKGCSADIDGQIFTFEKHHSGDLTQHSGSSGMHNQIWNIADHGPGFVVLKLALADGLGGFPGNREIELRYTVHQATLSMAVQATTDAPTPFNPANHSYWSLDPTVGFSGQTFQLQADHYSEPDEDLMPTGQILPVAGSQYDFRSGIKMAGDASQFFDLNLCISDSKHPLRPVATLTGAQGVRMEVATTECGLQVYDGGTIHAPDYGTHHGAPYGAYAALALEAQSWPGSLAHAHFPNIILRPTKQYEQITSWTFSAEGLG
jgi:aldose 1-epimerase|tara:strand:- start:584 stop:1594 length:1011 start_codon:yes stop_codon:yes gene_type:complete